MSASQERKRREVEIGFANNAFGATAGTVATVQARNAWKRSAKRGTMPNTRIGRLIGRSKISPGKAIMLAGAANVAGQATNGLLDAQSAHYFARERINMGPKKTVSKASPTRIEDAGSSTGRRIVEKADSKERDRKLRNQTTKDFAVIGAGTGAGFNAVNQMTHAMNEPRARRLALGPRSKMLAIRGTQGAVVGAGVGYGIHRVGIANRNRKRAAEGVEKARRFDPEADRQRRMGAYSGLAAGGALVVGDRAAREIGATKVKGKLLDKATGRPKAVYGTHVGFKPGRGKVGAALTAGTIGLGAIAAGTYRRGVSARNQPWT